MLRVVIQKKKSKSVQKNNFFSIRQETEPQGHKSAQMFPGYKMFLSDCKSAAEASAWMPFLLAAAKKAAPRVTAPGTFYATDAHCALA